jgi:hypothetical protein
MGAAINECAGAVLIALVDRCNSNFEYSNTMGAVTTMECYDAVKSSGRLKEGEPTIQESGLSNREKTFGDQIAMPVLWE